MTDQQNQGVVISGRKIFWWGVFALMAIIAFAGLSTAPLASFAIYFVLQYCTISVGWDKQFKAKNRSIEDEIGATAVGAIIAAALILIVSTIGLFWAVVLAVAFLALPFFVD